MLHKYGDAEILDIIDDEEIDDDETKKALKLAKQTIKNIDKDGNKMKLLNESAK
jgi:ParB-like chromosome segregation protein Spo0J